MIYVVGRAWLNPSLAPKPPEEEIEPYKRNPIFLLLAELLFFVALMVPAVLILYVTSALNFWRGKVLLIPFAFLDWLLCR